MMQETDEVAATTTMIESEEKSLLCNVYGATAAFTDDTLLTT